MEHARLKSANNVQFKDSCCKKSKIEEFRIFYLSFFACHILATVNFVDKVQNTSPSQPSQAKVLTGGWSLARSASRRLPVC